MEMTERPDAGALERRARRAYELGRLRKGFQVALWTAPMLFAALWCGTGTTLSCLLEAGLVMVTVALVWRSEGFAAGALPGLAAGSIPYGGMFALRLQGHGGPCGACETTLATCFLTTFTTGLVAGALIAVVARRIRPAWRRTAVASAVVIAALAGCLGCAFFGLTGVLGVLFGVALAGAPV